MGDPCGTLRVRGRSHVVGVTHSWVLRDHGFLHHTKITLWRVVINTCLVFIQSLCPELVLSWPFLYARVPPGPDSGGGVSVSCRDKNLQWRSAPHACNLDMVERFVSCRRLTRLISPRNALEARS